MHRKYLVTGGAGFIGSHLIDVLLKDKSSKVICVDNFSDFYSKDIKNENIKGHLASSNYKLHRIDITNYDDLYNIFIENEITHIIHLAACAGVRPSLLDPLKYNYVNVNGTLNLLHLAKQFNVTKFIFASSSSVYGARNDGPFREEMNVDRPISPYAATKIAGEQFCYTFSYLYDINITCLRFFTVYGPRQRPDLAIHKFTDLIYNNQSIPVFGNGDTKRDYTYIDDIIQGVCSAIEYDKTSFEIFNLGESQTVVLNYLIKLLEDNIGIKARIDWQPNQPGDVPITYADISKAQNLLNYKPNTKIEHGITKFIDWFNLKTNS